MCGIIGAIKLSGNKRVKLKELRLMNLSLEHRGPDAGGIMFQKSLNNDVAFIEDDNESKDHDEISIMLGHRRLSIFDFKLIEYCFETKLIDFLTLFPLTRSNL